MITIFDTDQDVTSKLPALKALGITDIGRYVAFGLEGEPKVIKPAEAHAIAAAGMRLFPIYEIGARTMNGAALGKRDGAYAFDYVTNKLGMPQGTAIFPCADYDALATDYPAISAYAAAFRAACDYLRLGAYANGYTCNRLKADGLIELRWLTCSMGFAGTRDAVARHQYEILQALPTKVDGLDTDPDTLSVANGDFGSRVPFAPAPPIAPAAPVVAQHPSIAPVSLVARIEREFGLV